MTDHDPAPQVFGPHRETGVSTLGFAVIATNHVFVLERIAAQGADSLGVLGADRDPTFEILAASASLRLRPRGTDGGGCPPRRLGHARTGLARSS